MPRTKACEVERRSSFSRYRSRDCCKTSGLSSAASGMSARSSVVVWSIQSSPTESESVESCVAGCDDEWSVSDSPLPPPPLLELRLESLRATRDERLDDAWTAGARRVAAASASSLRAARSDC